MEENINDKLCEQAAKLTYGMSPDLLNSGLLGKVDRLSQEDKLLLIRYICLTESPDSENMEMLLDDVAPYTQEELNARIDETEKEIDRGEGKSFQEMMSGFKQQLLWLK